MNLLDETINIHCVYALLCTPQSHLLSMYEKFEYCTDSCIRLSWTSAAIYHEWLERCIVAWVDAGDVFIVSAQFRGAPLAWYRNSRNRLCIYTPTLRRTPISLTPSTVLRSSTYVDLRSRLEIYKTIWLNFQKICKILKKISDFRKNLHFFTQKSANFAKFCKILRFFAKFCNFFKKSAR